MAQYGTIDVLVNPLMKSLTNTLDVTKPARGYYVATYPTGSANPPRFFGAYKSQRVATKRVEQLLSGLTLAYVVFFGNAGQFYWILQGQLPPT